MSLAAPLEWRMSKNLVSYPDALREMKARVEAIHRGTAGELVWLLEHPPLYTAGTSANPQDLVDPDRFPVYDAGRGGQYTYHGPGQRVVYFMLDLKKRGKDVRQFVWTLEKLIIDTLASFNVIGERREGRVGVWVSRPELGPGTEDKIAAIGVRVRRWVTFHGIAINLEPDLSHFTGIIPCGIKGHGVTSLHDLGLTVTAQDLDRAIGENFNRLFGRIPRPMPLTDLPPETIAGTISPSQNTNPGENSKAPLEQTHPTFILDKPA